MTAQWDGRLITRDEAGELAGAEMLFLAADPDRPGRLLLRHAQCGQATGAWYDGACTSADDVLAGVLRHLVSAHDMPLNRAERIRRRQNQNGSGNGNPGPGGAGGGDGSAAGGPAGPGGAGPGAGRVAADEADRRAGGTDGRTGGDAA